MSVTGPDDAAVTARRYGQLTYTSFDGRGVGGWQVKDQLGLSEAEQDLLRARIDPQLDTGTELPRFPSPDEVERFPRRLVFAPRPFGAEAVARENDGAVAWWHHASAGLDGSGRPGNVFTHVLVDRAPAGAAGAAGTAGAAPPDQHRGSVTHRPIDLWRSPDWLTPWGADAVLGATLGSRHPRPGDVIGSQGLAEFLLDVSHYRLGVLGVLLDACAAAVAGGPPVVLATENSDSAAWWVAAVTYLMSPGAATGFGFSTLERLASLPSRFAMGLPLCCVPRSDYDSLLDQQERTFVLLAEDESVLIGDLDGEPHSTAAGDRIVVTEWSVLAKVVLIDAATAVWGLSQLDAVAGQVEDADLSSEPAWPLAMVVAQAPQHFSDAITEASRVLVRRSPPALSRSVELLESARSLISDSLGAQTSDAWEPLGRVLLPGEPLTVVGEMMLSIYVTRAVADVRWLTRLGGPPVPQALWSGDRRPAEVADAVAAAVAALLETDLQETDPQETDPQETDPQETDPRETDPRDRQIGVALAALTDFTVRLGLLTGELLDAVSMGLERHFVHLLFAPDVDELVAALPRYAEETLEVVVRPLVNNAIGLEQRPLGERLTVGALRWLYGNGADDLLPPPNQPYEEFRLRSELAVQFVRRDPDRYAGERPLAAIALLEEGVDDTDVEELFAVPLWSVRELTAVESRFPGRLPLKLFGPTFKASPAGPDLDDLGTMLLRFRRSGEAYDPYGPGDLVRMRLAAGEAWWTSQRFLSRLSLVLSGAVHGLDYEEVPFHADALDQLYAALVLTIAGGLAQHSPDGGPSTADVRGLLRGVGEPAGVAGRVVWEVVRDGSQAQLELEQLIVAALLGEPDFPEPEISDPRYRWAHQVRVDVNGVRAPVLRHCVAREVAASTRSMDELADAVRGQFSPRFRRAYNPERTARIVQKHTQSWLKRLLPADGLLGRKR